MGGETIHSEAAHGEVSHGEAGPHRAAPEAWVGAPSDEAARATFFDDVLRGLGQRQKQIPSKYFYDERGSTLFDEICELEEYYVTRTEVAIMQEHGAEMAARLGDRCLLLEYGSGTSTKTYCLLDHVSMPAAYAPIDIAREHLMAAASRVARRYPAVEVLPVWADFTAEFVLPEPGWAPARRAAYFSGSTIGNFTREAAARLLAGMAGACGDGGRLLVGVDLVKPREVLERAYNDREGVTAAFNLNMLARANRELEADFDLESFRHLATWDEDEGRIEMHLESRADQTVHVGGRAFRLATGETILTEYSHKFTREGFTSIAESAGLRVSKVWTDPRGWFGVYEMDVAS